MRTLLKLAVLGAAVMAVPGTALADKATETRDVDTFTRVFIDGSADITIEAGSGQRVEVTADSEILPYVETEVRNGTLYVSQDVPRKLHKMFNRGATLRISVEKLEGVEIEGSGDIDATNIESDRFEAIVDGSGDIDLEGTCGDLYLEVNGSGDIDADQLKCTNAEVTIDGSGDVDIYATGSLKIDMEGSGDVTVYGDPQNVRPKMHGSGDLDFEDGK